LKARFNFDNCPEVKGINMQWSLSLINLIAHPKLKILIVTTRINLTIICQEQGMLESCTNLTNLKPVESSNFIRNACLFTFIWIKTALSKNV